MTKNILENYMLSDKPIYVDHLDIWYFDVVFYGNCYRMFSFRKQRIDKQHHLVKTTANLEQVIRWGCNSGNCVHILERSRKLIRVIEYTQEYCQLFFRDKDGLYYTKIFILDTLQGQIDCAEYKRRFEIREGVFTRYLRYFRDIISWLSLRIFIPSTK